MEPALVNKELIFTVTPGRSGSTYLARLLETIPDVSAHHEPSPNFAQVMRLVQTQPHIAYNYLTHYKFPAINNLPGRVYAETSHLACKGFIVPMIRMGLRPSLVILRRPPREVAWSFFERSTIPARSTPGIQDLLDPRDLGVVPLMGWDKMSNYQLCFWYALEIERRQLEYADLAYKLGLNVVDITNRDLNDWPKFAHLLTTFNLPVSEEIQRSHAQVSSTRHKPNPSYQNCPDSSNLLEEEEAVWSSVSHFLPLLRTGIEHRYADLKPSDHPIMGSALSDLPTGSSHQA